MQCGLLVAVLGLLSCASLVSSSNCTCKDPSWCEPVHTPVTGKEVFAFMVTNNHWKLYDWDKITTVASFAAVDPELVCFAHSKGKRVVYGANFPVANLTNPSDRHNWVTTQLNFIQSNNLDGINVDFEAGISPRENARRDGLSSLMRELYTRLKQLGSYYQVTFDSLYFPKSTYRAFDYKAIAKSIDFYMIMAYDMSGKGRAYANCDLKRVISGVNQYIEEGIPASKLVLGVPWYGYNYPCHKLVGNTCKLSEALDTIQGKAYQIGYKDIVQRFLPLAIGGIKIDKPSMSPYFNYKDPKTKQLHQIWFDNPQSLSVKYKYAVKNGLRGVGLWQADTLDYSNPTMIREMWGALPQY